MSAVNMDQKLFTGLLAGDRPVLVDFWAPWCGYCRRISAPYDRIAEEHQDHLVVGKVNVDEEAQLAQAEQFDVDIAPMNLQNVFVALCGHGDEG